MLHATCYGSVVRKSAEYRADIVEHKFMHCFHPSPITDALSSVFSDRLLYSDENKTSFHQPHFKHSGMQIFIRKFDRYIDGSTKSEVDAQWRLERDF